MNFKELLLRAKCGDEAAMSEIITMYKPLLVKESIVCGTFDEDLFQELCLTCLRCVHMIHIQKNFSTDVELRGKVLCLTGVWKIGQAFGSSAPYACFCTLTSA